MVVHFLTEKATKNTLIILFICMGIVLMALRSVYFDADRVLEEDTAWKISLAGQFEVSKDITIIQSARPKPGRYTRVISQRIHHPGLKILAVNPTTRGLIRTKAAQSGTAELLIEYHIHASQTPTPLLSSKPALTPEERQLYQVSDTDIDLSLQSLVYLNEVLHQDVNNKSELVHKIFLHSQKPVTDKQSQFDDLKTIISSNKTTPLGRARLMIALCRINNIPARLVTGFTLNEGTVSRPYHWVSIYNDEEQIWQSYDPEKGYERIVPKNYIVFSYGNKNILSVQNGKLVSAKYNVTEDIDILNVTRFEQEKTILDIFDLRRLDFESRQTLTKLLILPFCILLTAFFRHVLGFFPYGTFTAPLLALAMVYAEPAITLVVAGIVIFLALLGRSILPKTLVRAPRLSLIFTFVALSMVFSVSLLSYLSIDTGGNIILLPTVILAAIVDRFYSYMDESGTHAALLRLGVTIMIAIFCIPIFKLEDLGVLILSYPEFHLITAALVLLLSNYKGHKLTDYKYLKILGENKPKKAPRKKTTPASAD